MVFFYIGILYFYFNIIFYSGFVISDIIRLVADDRCKGIRFVPRVANGVAHSLAHLACSLYDDFVWMEDCPSSVFSLVLTESVVILDSVA
ncbi:hypothetical protein ACOSQ3_026868 [Xanthoceras sorbifolium]